MNVNPELTQYINAQLASGRGLEIIIQELKTIGWPDELIQMSTPKYPNSISSPVAAEQRREVRSGKTILIAVIVCFSLILIGSLFLVASNDNEGSGGSYTQFKDPNFTMSIPIAWSGDASYEEATTLIRYYSPEDANDANREKAARLTIYVDSDRNRIDRQLSSLGDSEYELIADESFTSDGTEYRYVELTARPESTPDNKFRFATVTAIKGDIIINADIFALDKYWELHDNDADTILKSIIPACTTKANPDALDGTGGVNYLCGE